MIGLSAIAMGFAAASSAQAECDGIYIALRAGGAKPTIDDDSAGSNRFDVGGTDLMLSGALGYRFKYFRAEFEYIWRDTNEDKSTVTIHDEAWDEDSISSSKGEFEYTSYMFNIYWDMVRGGWFTPYLNGGVGLTELEHTFSYHNKVVSGDGTVIQDDSGSDSFKKTRFTWSVGGGLSANLTSRMNLDVGYRYFDFGKLGGAQIHSHEVYGGIRYVF